MINFSIIINNYNYQIGPYHLVDCNNATLIRIIDLDEKQKKFLDVADFCIQRYWSHTINNNSHQSKEFRKNHNEHFGTYKLYSKMVYNSGDYLGTTGSCQDHLLFVFIYFIFYFYFYYIINN